MSRQDLGAAVRNYYQDPDVVTAFAANVSEGMTRFETALVRHAFAPGQRILDVGCGAGREGVAMVRQGLQVIGIDLVHEMAHSAVQRAEAGGVHLPILVANCLSLPFSEASFDGVTMLGQVITFIPSRELRLVALRSVLGVLRPGGMLAMTTHNRRCHPKFSLYFAWANRWRQICRRLGRQSRLGDYDRWSLRDCGVRAGSGQRLYFHMYDMDEALTDLGGAGFEILDARARTEFEAGRIDPTLRRRDYLLGFIARRPLRSEA
jgi:ubiquinone/menaquinone biosynthesis C-methylase UbiE